MEDTGINIVILSGDLNLGPKCLSLLEFETWRLRPLGHHGRSFPAYVVLHNRFNQHEGKISEVTGDSNFPDTFGFRWTQQLNKLKAFQKINFHTIILDLERTFLKYAIFNRNIFSYTF